MAQETAEGPKAGDTYRHPDPIADAALTWFVAWHGGEADEGAFEHWLKADPRHGAAFEQITQLAGMPELRQATLDARAAPMIPLPRRRAYGRRSWLAAGLAASVVLAVGLSLYPRVSTSWSADYATATGAQQIVTLPDGSRVHLNSDSALALDFDAGRRGVKLLSGEAFFDVQPDPARPFTVMAGFSTVEVKGTGFAVRREGEEDLILLDHGRVAVSPHTEPGRFALLAPGEQVSASVHGLSAVAKFDSGTLLAWREGRYRFQDETFGAVVANFQRYYSGRIVVLGAPETARVSGNYRLDDPVGALRSLAESAGARMDILPGGIIFLR